MPRMRHYLLGITLMVQLRHTEPIRTGDASAADDGSR